MPPPTHDLGGQHGFGPVPIGDSSSNTVFHEPWEGKAFALAQFAQGIAGFTTDGFRHGIEREDPTLYRSLSYWHRWARNANRMLFEGGVISRTGAPPTRTTDCSPPIQRGAKRQPLTPARFAVGQRVRASAIRVSAGHTRLPTYAHGRVGTVKIVNDVWVYPDTNAHGQGEQPVWVYAVAFAARDLWPDNTGASQPTHEVIVDLYEPYLETA